MNAATQPSHPEPSVIGQNLYQYDQPQPNGNNEIPIAPPYSRYPWDIPVPSGPSVPTGQGAALTGYNSPPANVEQQQPQHQDDRVLSFDGGRFVVVRPRISFAIQKSVACLLIWFLVNPTFGIIAYMLAVAASNKAATDPQAARKLGRASYGVSLLGLVVTVVVVAFVVIFIVCLPGSSTSCSHGHLYNDVCYKYKTAYWPSSVCVDYYFGTYESSTGDCYYNDRTTTLANSPMACAGPYMYGGKCYKYRNLSSNCYYGTYDSSTGYCYSDYTTPAPTTAPKFCLLHYYNGVCYKYRLYYQSSSYCYFGMYDFTSNYCYYN